MTDPVGHWSEALRRETREARDEFAFVPNGDAVCLKHIDGRFGWIAVADVLGRRLRVIERPRFPARREPSSPTPRPSSGPIGFSTERRRTLTAAAVRRRARPLG